jgi:hypothetical protein
MTSKNTVWYRQKKSQISAHHIAIMGNFLTKSAKWSLLDKKEIKEDQDSEEYCEATALAEEMMRPSGCHNE